MMLFRAVFIAIVATVLLIAPQSGAEAQFPRGLLASPPGQKTPGGASCTIETRPLSFGNFDPEAGANLDAVAQVIYTCDNQAKKIRIEMTTGNANQFSPRKMTAGTGLDFLDYNIYLDATRQTIWGQGAYGTDVYYVSNPPNGTSVIVPAYGRIAGRQNPPPTAGQYVDVLTVRILF
jgi:spore coat protein U-like protein